jgi:pre-mRNA-splicing factor CDC5/CEF1
VASLLNKKTAKQAKARWHEWLDPSVRKVEWSREEEEKLLHLAKLMPAQWKTIGPLVGRTASQCQEQYEKLLDSAAQGKEGDDQGDDLRTQSQQQLRAGQIDSHPETKPARPDPIDMDEDEIEMLQEARARLANTQGKKAKRKAREKMLAQAKRLADLQKRRELKQAGLLSSQAKKKARKRNRDIDLGVEIPFHKPAPAGFHDVGVEDERAESMRAKQQKAIDFHKLNEQQYHSRDREAAQAKKREEARLRTLEKSNMQYVVAQVSKANDPLNIRKRAPLSLPAPSVTDQELSQIAKLEQAQKSVPALVGGSDATQALLGDYSDRPLPTPMRTPMTAATGTASAMSRQKNIMREASNLRMLERGQTPLLGGDNPELETTANDDDTKLAGRSDLSTATPVVPDRNGGGQTPRDQLGLNRPMSELREGIDDSASVGASTFATTSQMSIRELAREERRATKRARKQLEDALAALPAPQYEYELAAPADMDIDEDDRVVVETVDEDAADVEAGEREALRKEADKLYEARSSVVKRADLPRPVGAIPESLPSVAVDEYERLVEEERFTLLRHDAHAFPVEPPPSLLDDSKKSKKKKKKQAPTSTTTLPPETPLEYIPEDALNHAKQLIQQELAVVVKEKTAPLLNEDQAKSEADALEILAQVNARVARSSVANEIFYQDGWIEKKSDEQVLTSLQLEFETIQEATTALRKKTDKTESKVIVLTGGYANRSQTLGQEILQMHGDLQNAVIEEAVYKNLQQSEELGSVRRIDRFRQDIQKMEQDHAQLNEYYQELVEKKQSKTAAS